MNDLIRAKLKEIFEFKKVIHVVNQNVEKLMILVNNHYLMFFKKYT